MEKKIAQLNNELHLYCSNTLHTHDPGHNSLLIQLLIALQLALLVEDQQILVADLRLEFGELVAGEENLHTGAAREFLVDLVHQKMAAVADQILLILGLCFDLTITVAY